MRKETMRTRDEKKKQEQKQKNRRRSIQQTGYKIDDTGQTQGMNDAEIIHNMYIHECTYIDIHEDTPSERMTREE